MKLRMCSCRMCRRGRRAHHAITRQRLKGYRAKARRLLRAGDYDRLPVAVPVDYTD